MPIDYSDSARPVSLGSTDEALLQDAQSAGEASWEKIVRIYGPAIYQTVRRAGLQPADAADITQTVLIELLRSLKKFNRVRKGSFRKWLKVITRNKLIDLMRQRNNHFASPLDSGVQAPEGVPETDELLPSARQILLLEILREVKESVTDKTWQAFELMQANRESSGEIGRRLGLSASAVRMAQRRVLIQIQLMFHQAEQEEF